MSAGATAATADKDGPVAPLPGEPAPMKAEARVPHPADLLALPVPSQWIREAAEATSRDQAPRTAGSAAQCELQLSGNEKSGDEPPLGGLWEGTHETGQQGGHTRPCGANQSAPERKAASAAHPDELKPGLQIRRLWRQRNVKRRPAERLAPRNFRSGGALWGSSGRSIKRRLAGRLVPRTFPSGGALWSLKTDAGGEMKRPIIEAAVEEACSKSSSHGECSKSGGGDREDQGSCGNGNKRPAGIAAPREKWEDFVGAVEDIGDEDDPQNATRSQAGHPVQADHGSCQHQRWEQGKFHSELREKKELRPGRNSPSFDAATGRRTNRGVCRLHTAMFHWPLSSTATKEVQGPDTT
jgi:hypothetical protein